MYHYQGIQPNLNPNDQRNKKNTRSNEPFGIMVGVKVQKGRTQRRNEVRSKRRMV